ncbi:plakophilin-2 isoform X2 [Thamnophis elegans]|uniref:plakophilin-2 isoform X2 n=1 Tax=Thamnophis elegans TaxID=35005 RepID=UPI00137872B7|nr:plakophilin-2 isoform X2 [Thamnophis elegans]
MAVPVCSPDPGYIRTVLGQQGLDEQDSSTLALPSKLSGGRAEAQKSLRIQRQIQQTLARKSRGSLVNGLHRASSVPEYVYELDGVETDFASRPSFATSYYQSHRIGSQSSYENGWGPRSLPYNYRAMEERFHRQPLKRLEVSPESTPEKPFLFHADMRYNKALTFRQNESKRACALPPRYARSEILGYTSRSPSSRGPRQFYIEPTNETMVDYIPFSPGVPLYQRVRNSQSMSNIFEKENYPTSGAAVGQARSSMHSQVGTQHRHSSWHQGTVRKQSTKEASMSTSFSEGGGKRTTMTAAMAAAGANGIVEQERISASRCQIGNPEAEMNLERAVHILQSENPLSPRVLSAIVFIQHESFQRAEARRKVYSLLGIPKLLELLNVQNEEVQRAACGALRNLVYEDNDNKLEVSERKGISILLRLLQQTRDVETKKQITGLLWNLSSNDQLKNVLIWEALQPLTETVLIPYTGWPDRDYPKSSIIPDPDIFYNATGCLRNMSSAGPEGRKKMRECDGLIDSLVYYIQGTTADRKPDDKATENCVCVLHNLSYQLEDELPNHYTEKLYVPKRDDPSRNNIGCFGTRSRKAKQKQQDTPLPEEKSNPRGIEKLWHSTLIRIYLSLIAESTRNFTQEASLGALQNLTAGSGPMPFGVAHIIVKKANGLPNIISMLHVSNVSVRKTAVSLLRNLSRNTLLHNEIARVLLPELMAMLPNYVPTSNVDNDIAASACYALYNLTQNSSSNARLLLNNDGISKVINISQSDNKSGRAASILLYSLWSHTDLHSAYKKAGYKKVDFINNRTLRAYNLLRD